MESSTPVGQRGSTGVAGTGGMENGFAARLEKVVSGKRQLFWRQGLFLTPQHLQQQDAFHIWQRQCFWRLGQPFGWGVVSLQIREEGLEAGEFDVVECELVTRSGLGLRGGSGVAHGNARFAPRSFKEFLAAGGEPLAVFLALPRRQPGRPDISSAEPAAGPQQMPQRYGLIGHQCDDAHDPEAPAREVQFLEHNLALLFEREPGFAKAEQAYELIKIAELRPLSDAAGVGLSSRYIPPCLKIASSAVLVRRLQALRDLLTVRAQEFAELKRQRGVRATASTTQELLRLTMLQSLGRYVPLLHHYLEHMQVHPEPVYALLRQMVGELSVFSERFTLLGAEVGEAADIDGLPPYDHDALWWCFETAIARLQELVLGMTHGPESGVRLAFDGEYYQAALEAEFFVGERSRYYLMIDSPVGGEELTALLQRTGKISAMEDMPRLRQSALFGLKINYLPVPPEELPQRGARYSYFAVDVRSPQWRRIQEAGNIAVFCDLDPGQTMIKLFVVRGE